MGSAQRAATFHLTPRDVAMLQSLAAARYLGAEELERLHFPGWLPRWQRWRDGGMARPYHPSAQLYLRLRGMEQTGLIERIHRPVAQAVAVFKRAPDLFRLAPKGAQVAATYSAIDVDEIWVARRHKRAYDNLVHTSLIGTVYAALRAKAEASAGVALHDWRNDVDTARCYDRVEARVPDREGGWRRERLSVQPDGVFVLERQDRHWLCFLEVQRDQSPQSWKRKVAAWEAYTGSQELHTRYGHAAFIVLAVRETAAQRQTLMRHTAQALWQQHGQRLLHEQSRRGWYLFTTLDDAHPTRIGASWLRIGAVTPHEQWLPNGGVYERVTIEATPFRLIG